MSKYSELQTKKTLDKLGQPWKDCNPTGQRHTLVLLSEMIGYDVGLRHGEICKNVVAASCISIKYGITDFFKGESLVFFL